MILLIPSSRSQYEGKSARGILRNEMKPDDSGMVVFLVWPLERTMPAAFEPMKILLLKRSLDDTDMRRNYDGPYKLKSRRCL